MKQLLTSALLFAITLPSASGQSLAWSPVIDLGEASSSALRPRIEVSVGGAIVLWSAPPEDILFCRITNGTAQPPTLVQPEGTLPWTTTWAGGDLAAHGDTVVVVYSTGSLGVGSLYASRSTDGGLTWPDTTRVGPVSGQEARFPTVAYVPGQGPIVQYMEFESNWSVPRYVMSASHDGGSSFDTPVPVSVPFAPGEVCDCCTGQVVTDGNNVVALFRNNNANRRTIWGVSSSNGGNSFSVGQEVDETAWNVNGCPSSGPDAYIFGDSVRTVWMSGASDGVKIYGSSSALGSMNTSATRRIHATAPANVQQNFPRIAGHGDTLGVVWEQSYLGQRDILFSWSVNGWNGLSVPDTVNSTIAGAQRTPDVAFSHGTFHLVWEETSNGNLGYRTAAINAYTGIVTESAIRTISCWPNPSTGPVFVDLPNGTATITVVDASGRLVLDIAPRSRIDLTTLEDGTYTLRFLDRSAMLLGTVRVVKERN